MPIQEPKQRFSVLIDQVQYNVRVMLNARSGIWTLSLSVAGENLVAGVPLLGGVNILKQYNLPLQNAFVVNIENGNLDPERDNLGTVVRLLFLEQQDLDIFPSLLGSG